LGREDLTKETRRKRGGGNHRKKGREIRKKSLGSEGIPKHHRRKKRALKLVGRQNSREGRSAPSNKRESPQRSRKKQGRGKIVKKVR